MYSKEQVKLAVLNGTTEEIKGDMVNSAVRRRYSLSEELAILRQRYEKPEEFAAFNTYVENCKVEARAVIEEALAEVHASEKEEVRTDES